MGQPEMVYISTGYFLQGIEDNIDRLRQLQSKDEAGQRSFIMEVDRERALEEELNELQILIPSGIKIAQSLQDFAIQYLPQEYAYLEILNILLTRLPNKSNDRKKIFGLLREGRAKEALKFFI